MSDTYVEPEDFAEPDMGEQPQLSQLEHVPAMVTDIPSKIYEAGKAGLSKVNRHLNPFSEEYGRDMDAYIEEVRKSMPFDLRPHLKSVGRTGSGLMGGVETVAAPVTGTARSVIGHAHDAIMPPVDPELKARLEKEGISVPSGDEVADLAISALAPGRGGLRAGRAPTPAPPTPPAPRSPMDVRLSRGQETGELPLIQKEQEALRGTLGPKAQEHALAFEGAQKSDLAGAKQHVLEQADTSGRTGAPVAQSPHEAAEILSSALQQDQAARAAALRNATNQVQQVHEGLRAGYAPNNSVLATNPSEAANITSGAVTRAYENAQEAANAAYGRFRELPGQFHPASFNNVAAEIRTRVARPEDPTQITLINPQRTPNASAALDELQEILGGIAQRRDPETGRVLSRPPVTPNLVENARTRLNTYRGDALNAARSTHNWADVRAMENVIDEFDAAVARKLRTTFRGGDAAEVVRALDEARGLYRDYRRTFTSRGSGDTVGPLIQQIIGRHEGQALTPEALGGILYSTGQRSVPLGRRLVEIFGAESPEVGALRQGLFSHITERPPGATAWGPEQIANRIDQYTRGAGRSLTETYMTPAQVRTLQNYGQLLRQHAANVNREPDAIDRIFSAITGGEGGNPASTQFAVRKLFSDVLSNSRDSIELSRRIKSRFGANSPEYGAYRQGLLRHAMEQGQGTADFGLQKIAKNLKEFSRSQAAREVYDAPQLDLIRELGNLHQKLVVPQRGANWSNTAKATKPILDKIVAAVSAVAGGFLAHQVAPFSGGLAEAAAGWASAKGSAAFTNARYARKIAKQMPMVGDDLVRYQRALASYNKSQNPMTKKALSAGAANLSQALGRLGIEASKLPLQLPGTLPAEEREKKRADGGVVEQDPFEAAAQRTRSSVMRDVREPVRDDRAGAVNQFFDQSFGRNGTERFQYFPERWARAAISEFDRAASGQFPDTVYVPEGGMVSDEDLARRYEDMNAGAEGASNFAMIGGPLNMIAKGARPGGATLGSAMGTGAESAPPHALPLYSAVEQFVAGTNQKEASPDQWLGMLKNAKGLKQEELDWLGVEPWLREQPGPVTRKDLADFIHQNKVELKEVHKYDDESDAFRDVMMDRGYELAQKWQAIAPEIASGDAIKVVGHSGSQRDIYIGPQLVKRTHKDNVKYEVAAIKQAAARATEEPAADYLFDLAHDTASNYMMTDMEARHGTSSRVLPGGENYREMLLTLPPKGAGYTVAQGDGDNVLSTYWGIRDPNGDWVRDARGNPVWWYNEDVARNEGMRHWGQGGEFRVAGHWNEPNVLAWTRMKDREIDGGKSLFLEEVQSDWHQQGREKGYRTSPQEEAAKKRLVKEAYDKWRAENNIPWDVPPDRLVHTGAQVGYLRPEHPHYADAVAWKHAYEANNPEVFDLTKKAYAAKKAEHDYTTQTFRNELEPYLEEIAGNYTAGTMTPEEVRNELGDVDSLRGLRDLVSADLLSQDSARKIEKKLTERWTTDEGARLRQESEAAQRALEAAQSKNRGAVPDAPLKKAWHETVLKRMIREAAEKGYDSLSWTTGTQQNKRWRLSNFVDSLTYDPRNNHLEGKKKGVQDTFSLTIPPEKLPEYLGKEVAEKLLSSPEVNPNGSPLTGAEREYGGYHILNGLDLEVGGSGMRGFYDKMMVDAANKIAKQYGAKVEKKSLVGHPDIPWREMDDVDWEAFAGADQGSVIRQLPDGSTQIKSPDGVVSHIDSNGEDGSEIPDEIVHVLKIPPALKKQALEKGFPMFQAGLPTDRSERKEKERADGGGVWVEPDFSEQPQVEGYGFTGTAPQQRAFGFPGYEEASPHEVAASRVASAARPMTGRQEGKTTAFLEHLGEDVYNMGARPSRIWRYLNSPEMQGASSLQDHPELVTAAVQTGIDITGLPGLAAPRMEGALTSGARKPIVNKGWLAPAYDFDGTIYKSKPGTTHADALENLRVGEGLKHNDLDGLWDELDASAGFVTPSGKFLTREEALQYAKRNRQLDAESYSGMPALDSVELAKPKKKGAILRSGSQDEKTGATVLASEAAHALPELPPNNLPVVYDAKALPNDIQSFIDMSKGFEKQHGQNWLEKLSPEDLGKLKTSPAIQDFLKNIENARVMGVFNKVLENQATRRGFFSQAAGIASAVTNASRLSKALKTLEAAPTPALPAVDPIATAHGKIAALQPTYKKRSDELMNAYYRAEREINAAKEKALRELTHKQYALEDARYGAQGASGEDVMHDLGIPEKNWRTYWANLRSDERDRLLQEYRNRKVAEGKRLDVEQQQLGRTFLEEAQRVAKPYDDQIRALNTKMRQDYDVLEEAANKELAATRAELKLPELSPDQQRVLDYVVRKTGGYRGEFTDAKITQNPYELQRLKEYEELATKDPERYKWLEERYSDKERNLNYNDDIAWLIHKMTPEQRAQIAEHIKPAMLQDEHLSLKDARTIANTFPSLKGFSLFSGGNKKLGAVSAAAEARRASEESKLLKEAQSEFDTGEFSKQDMRTLYGVKPKPEGGWELIRDKHGLTGVDYSHLVDWLEGAFLDSVRKRPDFASTLERLPRYSGTVYRGLSLSPQQAGKLLKKLTPGKTYTIDRHSSASKNKMTAKHFAVDAPDEEPVSVIFDIGQSTGRAIPSSVYKHANDAHSFEFDWQKEVILPKGMKLKVLSVNKNAQIPDVYGPVTLVRMREVK